MTLLYSSYSTLPAYLELEEQAQLLKKAYEIGIGALKAKLKTVEADFVKKREQARANAKFTYSLVCNENEHGRHYTITRKIVDPLIGDDSFNKDIVYSSFKLVNQVFIYTGSGYILPNVKNGDIISAEDIAQLVCDIVPDRFKTVPKFDGKNYLCGT